MARASAPPRRILGHIDGGGGRGAGGGGGGSQIVGSKLTQEDANMHFALCKIAGSHESDPMTIRATRTQRRSRLQPATHLADARS